MSSKNEDDAIYMKQYREMLEMCEKIEERISALEDKLNKDGDKCSHNANKESGNVKII